MTWIGIKLFFSKVWAAIKKLPHWALLALMLLFTTVVSLMRKNAADKKLLEIQKEISDIEKKRAESIAIADTTNREEEKAIRKEYDDKLTELREVEKDLHEAEVSGPVAVAQEWSDYLLKKEKE